MGSIMKLALYQPDIAQNTGTLMRLCACMGVSLEIIEPCGFLLDDRRLKRAGLDYMQGLDWRRHKSWPDFYAGLGRENRLILLTTQAHTIYTDVDFDPDDVLLLGSESAGVPKPVHDAADLRIKIPMREGFRSLNQAVSGAMVLGEALRQIRKKEAGYYG